MHPGAGLGPGIRERHPLGPIGVAGQGALGWNVTGGATGQHFPNESDMIAFVTSGSTQGAKYGTQGQGTGRMPGFGNMLTAEQIAAIVEEGIASGEFADVDSADFAIQLAALLDGLAIEVMLRDPTVDAARMEKLAMGFVEMALKTRV